MQLVCHRLNAIEAVMEAPPKYGVEVDLRSKPTGEIYCAHDAFVEGPLLSEWLRVFLKRSMIGAEAAPLILNVKEDGLHERLIDQFQPLATPFFILDLPIPSIVRGVRDGLGEHLAIRFSEFEPLVLAERFAGRVKWVWVDCFDGKPLSVETLRALQRFAYRICIVSPELQGFDSSFVEAFSEVRSLLRESDAVCTKLPRIWESI